MMFRFSFKTLFYKASIIFIALFSSEIKSQDTVRIMHYNLLNFPNAGYGREAYFRTINQYLQANIILVNELLSNSGAITLLEDGLNVFGNNRFNKAEFIDGPDTDHMLFYDSTLFFLYSQDTIQTELRLINEYVLYYKPSVLSSNSDTTFLYLYSAHLKASTGSTNEQQRLAEVMKYKTHVNAMPNIENMFFTGDLNLYTSSEPAYSALINDGLYPLIDVLPALAWQDDPTHPEIHTQSTRTVSINGGATGGLDDRFDFNLFTGDVLSGSNGITYIPNTMIPVGNDGNHLNVAITAPPLNTSVPDSVLQALYLMSDHLPLICDIEIQTPNLSQTITLDLKVFLEGPFDDIDMRTDLNPILPLSQPYNIPPWNYTGTESVPIIPNQNIVDWILIELRDAPDALSATSLTIIARQACFLLKDGSIVGLDGISLPQFNDSFSQQLFVVMWHRNHLGIMSANGFTDIVSVYNCDFSVSLNQVYGSSLGYKILTNNICGMVSGDSNHDGLINFSDKVLWSNFSGMNIYFDTDFSMDREVNNPDKNNLWLLNQTFSLQVPQ